MPTNNIRNFCIISHIDHGKSTLADRLLEITNTVPPDKMQDQYLDQMDLEKERGITIKMQPVRMVYHPASDSKYILNLIDTPGHMDFAYEVERALQACEGAILLVSAKEGIQAQTLANLNLAKKQGLKIIPVINKIDIKETNPKARAQEVDKLLNKLRIEYSPPVLISAKQGKNVKALLNKIVSAIPPPQKASEDSLKALVFDSLYDKHKGVLAYVRLFGGQIKAGDKIQLYHKKVSSKVREVGIFGPHFLPKDKLKAGEIGWMACGIKQSSKLYIGETICKQRQKINPLPGYKPPQPQVFTNLFPAEKKDFSQLKKALNKLKLNDPSLSETDSLHPTMGPGVRVGVLGMLHLEIVLERLKREYGIKVVVTPPSVTYKVTYEKKGQTRTKKCLSPAQFPPYGKIKTIKEPVCKVEIITPVEVQSKIHNLVENARGVFQDSKTLSPQRLLLTFKIPLAEIMTNFCHQLKSVSQGFASFSYKILGFQEADLVKIEFLVAGGLKEGLSKIACRKKADTIARKTLKKLKEILPQENFPVKLQARIQGRIIAREDMPALKKDVTSKLYGGDYTRKKKLLARQRKGKKKMAKREQVRIQRETYHKLLGFS